VNRRGKIVCTLGPATATDEAVRALVEAGMDVARLNFSHGEYTDHEANYKRVRGASDTTGRAVGILADLQGPKIRLGRFAAGPTYWADAETVRITVDDCAGTHDRVSTTYKRLAEDAAPGDRVLVDDGNIGLVVEQIDGNDVVCRVTDGGPVSNSKGMSLPGMNVSAPALSEKDIEDLEFALRLGVDLVALSFVRSPADIELVHEVMDRVGRRVPVIAKLEKPEAVDNLEAIVLAFDAIMVARGDLGVELPLEEVPLVQKRAIQMARENAKPVIVATQMLESMIENSRPTRAEASDVANAVLDGADAVMLSGETSVGKFPLEAGNQVAVSMQIGEWFSRGRAVNNLTRIVFQCVVDRYDAVLGNGHDREFRSENATARPSRAILYRGQPVCENTTNKIPDASSGGRLPGRIFKAQAYVTGRRMHLVYPGRTTKMRSALFAILVTFAAIAPAMASSAR